MCSKFTLEAEVVIQGIWSATFCFFPEAGSPLRMLASMASMSFIITPNILSQKLNTSWGEREGFTRTGAKMGCYSRWLTGRHRHKPAGRPKTPGCWTAGWTRQPSCQNHRGTSRCSSSAGSRFRLSWRRCTAWTCQSYSCRLRGEIRKNDLRWWWTEKYTPMKPIT